MEKNAVPNPLTYPLLYPGTVYNLNTVFPLIYPFMWQYLNSDLGGFHEGRFEAGGVAGGGCGGRGVVAAAVTGILVTIIVMSCAVTAASWYFCLEKLRQGRRRRSPKKYWFLK